MKRLSTILGIALAATVLPVSMARATSPFEQLHPGESRAAVARTLGSGCHAGRHVQVYGAQPWIVVHYRDRRLVSAKIGTDLQLLGVSACTSR